MLVSHISIILLFETGPHYVLEHYVDPAVLKLTEIHLSLPTGIKAICHCTQLSELSS